MYGYYLFILLNYNDILDVVFILVYEVGYLVYLIFFDVV